MDVVPDISSENPVRNSMRKPTPNHALQPTGVRVTAHAAHHLRPMPPSPAHGPRHARPWLSLGSLGVFTRLQ